MNIKKSLPYDNFSKISNNVFRDKSLTDGAVRLYGILVGLPNGKRVSDEYLAKCMDVTSRSVNNRKAELRNAGLIYSEKLAPRVFDLYVGHPNMPAQKVKEMWEKDYEA